MSFLAKFGSRPCTIVQGLWPDFGANLKIHKKSILIGTSSKFLYNIGTCICIIKCNKNGEFSPCHFWQNLAQDPVLYIVQGLWPDFGANLKIHKKSNFDWNQLKISTQHKYMYVYQKM